MASKNSVSQNGLRGVWSAVLTPVQRDLHPDADAAIAYYRDLLNAGCDGINLLGTTGQAAAFSTAARLEFMRAVAAALPRDRCMVGTGAESFEATAALTQTAFELGYAAALVLPPPSLRGCNDDAIYDFFETLLQRTGSGRVMLYHFPRSSGVAFSAELVERLLHAFPHAIAGIKDSANDRALQRDVARRLPEFAVFPSSEAYLREALAAGAAGCISGTVALWPGLAQAVYQSGDECAAEALANRRHAIEGDSLIENVRRAVALQRNDDSWLRSPV